LPTTTQISGFALFILILGACGSGLGRTYSTLEPLLKEDAAYSERLLNAGADSPDANLKEFDDFCDRSVELRTERSIKIQAVLSDSQADLKKTISDHFNAENSLVRAKRRFYDSYFELKGLRARLSDLTQKADMAQAMGNKYNATAGEVDNSENLSEQDFAKLKQRAQTALQFSGQALNLRVEGVRLGSAVNAAVTKALEAGNSYTESLEKASATEKRLSGDLAKSGHKIGRPSMPRLRMLQHAYLPPSRTSKARRSNKLAIGALRPADPTSTGSGGRSQGPPAISELTFRKL
jgi:hypothetical protein